MIKFNVTLNDKRKVKFELSNMYEQNTRELRSGRILSLARNDNGNLKCKIYYIRRHPEDIEIFALELPDA